MKEIKMKIYDEKEIKVVQEESYQPPQGGF
jgi:hypothetical protein